MKQRRENSGKNSGHWNGQDFFGPDPKNIGNKGKIRQMGLHKTKKFLHSKGNM
jgi:hypothetical protein